MYLNELIATNKPEQQNQWFWFPTSGKNENHTPIQTQVLNELTELKEKEKLNPTDKAKSRLKFL